jgi:hypothetical protein
MRRDSVNAILEKSSCKRKRHSYIRFHTAMLRTTGHIDSRTTRLSVTVAIYPCAATLGSLPKLGMLPRNRDWSNADP